MLFRGFTIGIGGSDIAHPLVPAVPAARALSVLRRQTAVTPTRRLAQRGARSQIAWLLVTIPGVTSPSGRPQGLRGRTSSLISC